jgi:hypothetical protein
MVMREIRDHVLRVGTRETGRADLEIAGTEIAGK